MLPAIGQCVGWCVLQGSLLERRSEVLGTFAGELRFDFMGGAKDQESIRRVSRDWVPKQYSVSFGSRIVLVPKIK